MATMSHMSLLSTFVPIQTASFANSSLTMIKLVSAKPPSSARTVAASKSAAMEMKKREPSGIMKPRRVSPEMQEFLGGVSEIPRTQALKEIWANIKQHDLQDPTDKKVIICDEKLKKIFGGKERVGFLEIAGLMSPHFLK